LGEGRLAPSRSTTLSSGSFSQVSTGKVCVFVLILSAAPARCLPVKQHGKCQTPPGMGVYVQVIAVKALATNQQFLKNWQII
jgi:hypothetical protein